VEVGVQSPGCGASAQVNKRFHSSSLGFGQAETKSDITFVFTRTQGPRTSSVGPAPARTACRVAGRTGGDNLSRGKVVTAMDGYEFMTSEEFGRRFFEVAVTE